MTDIAGEFKESFTALFIRIDLAEISGERWRLPEIHRLRGELLLTM